MLSTRSIVRMAIKVQRVLERYAADPGDNLYRDLKNILVTTRLLKRQHKIFTLAREHYWQSASRQLQENLLMRVRELHEAASQIIFRRTPVTQFCTPTLRDLCGEIRQLEDEFTSVSVDLKAGMISVDTDEIELKGLYLGSFRIKLSMENLGRYAESRAFVIEALDPQPAASNEEVIHPHVQSGALCAGDATSPIASALKEGRLADAFLAVNSVLHNYNPSSPYVAIEDWQGTRCSDCECLVDEDRSYRCNGCENTVCDECSRCCEVCDDVYCLNCLETIEDSELKYLCEHCRARCDGCDGFAVADEIKDGLCPKCFQQQEQENTDEQSNSDSACQNSGAAIAGASADTAGSPQTAVPAPA